MSARLVAKDGEQFQNWDANGSDSQASDPLISITSQQGERHINRGPTQARRVAAPRVSPNVTKDVAVSNQLDKSVGWLMTALMIAILIFIIAVVVAAAVTHGAPALVVAAAMASTCKTAAPWLAVTVIPLGLAYGNYCDYLKLKKKRLVTERLL
jgi:hypothetical protein